MSQASISVSTRVRPAVSGPPFIDRQPADDRDRGISFARCPALILGTILLVAGLYFIYKQHTFPKFAQFPNGKTPTEGKVFFGIFGANGWTRMLTAVAGGLLLFGAAQHLLAKTMSLVVAIALAIAAIIGALSSGNVVGMVAANGWAEIGWGACAAILLFNPLIPRRKETIAEDHHATPRREPEDPAPARASSSTSRGSADDDLGARSAANGGAGTVREPDQTISE